MKKYFLGAAALLALTACSNDETVDLNQDGNVISFAVTANNPSRAATGEVFNNAALPGIFKVWAAHNNKNYFSGEVYHQVSTTSTYESSFVHYWPTEGNVTFLAMCNQNGALSWTPEGPTDIAKLTGFTVAPTAVATDGFYKAENQKDFIYALTSQAKPEDGTPGQVKLNFRHGLAQVEFRARVNNRNLHVDIEGVSVCNAYGKADVTFPYANVTDGNFNDATEATVPSGEFKQAVWGNLRELTDYTLTFSSKSVSNGDSGLDLTADNINRITNAWTLLLLPQTTTAWDVNGGRKPGDAAQTGSYFLVKCKIRNVANASAVTDDDVYLWGSKDEAKYIAVPAAFNWEQGKKYTYTFVFNNSNGGYDPDTNEPVLVPVTFNVTVDDFAKGDKDDVIMR